MSQDATAYLRIRKEDDVAVVNFLTPYLQTEDVIQTVAVELSRLVEDEGFTKVLLSFAGVRFLSSSMLAQIVKLQKKLTRVKGRVRISALPPAMKDVMRISQLDRMLEVFDDEAEALAAF